MVEAAGVEPASEKACCQKNYMLIPFAGLISACAPVLAVSRSPVANGQEPNSASPMGLAARPRTEGVRPAR